MGKFKTVINLLTRNRSMIKKTIGIKFGHSILSRLFPDKTYLKIQTTLFLDRSLNLNHPETFNEKMQWLKLNDRNPTYTIMVDKFKAKEYAREIIGDEHIIPTYGCWEKFEDINFDELPERFVLKCNHDSGSVVICKSKKIFDLKMAKAKIEKGLHTDGYYWGREWPYTNVERRIIAEEFLHDNKEDDLPDYKVHCFGGVPKFILVCKDRFSKTGMTEDFYDTNWKSIDVSRPNHKRSSRQMDRPKWLEEMLHLSELLSKGIPFLRVDFYVVNEKLYLGELTLYPASGFEKFVPEEYDALFGSWIPLPKNKLS